MAEHPGFVKLTIYSSKASPPRPVWLRAATASDVSEAPDFRGTYVGAFLVAESPAEVLAALAQAEQVGRVVVLPVLVASQQVCAAAELMADALVDPLHDGFRDAESAITTAVERLRAARAAAGGGVGG